MPILRINAEGRSLKVVNRDVPLTGLAETLKDRVKVGPTLIMLHGFRYSPSIPSLDPHAYILQAGHADSWPRQMGFGAATPGHGLCIAFGWEAGGTIWRAHREAGRAGVALADLIRQLNALGAGPVNIMAHSLGARVALAALHHLAHGAINRMILMTGAELRSTAEMALMTPAGRSAQVLNVISRENDVFDFIYEWLLVPHRRGARTLGAGLALPQCVTAQIDNPDHLIGLARLGFPIPTSDRRICHWSSYTRPGLFPLYRGFLSGASPLELADLRANLPVTLSQRWSRLWQRPLQAAPFGVQIAPQ